MTGLNTTQKILLQSIIQTNKKGSGAVHIWVIICWKTIDKIRLIFSPSLILQCAFLCLPGSLELGCSWTSAQSKSPCSSIWPNPNVLYFQAIIFNCHITSTVRDFHLIPKLRARHEYQLSSGT